MSIKEVDQGTEKELYVAFESAMDVRDVVVAFPTDDGANAEGISTKSTLTLPVNQQPRDWTHLLLRVTAADGRQFFMSPAGNSVDTIITARRQYSYDEVGKIIHASGLEATDVVTMSAMTAAGSNYCPLSFVGSFDITDGSNVRAVYDRRTLSHFKAGNPDLSGSCSQKYQDFFEPENVRQFFSCARNLTEIYNLELDAGTFGEADGLAGAVKVWNVPLKIAGVADSPMAGSINYLRDPNGDDLVEATDVTDLATAEGKFLITEEATAFTSNGQMEVLDSTLITQAITKSRDLVVTHGVTFPGTSDELVITYGHTPVADKLDVTFQPDTSVSTADKIDVPVSADTFTASSDTLTFDITAGATANNNVNVDIQDNAVTISGGLVSTAVLNGDTAQAVSDKMVTALDAAIGVAFTVGNAGGTTTVITVQRVATGSVNTISTASFDATTTGVTKGADIFTAGIAVGNFNFDLSDAGVGVGATVNINNITNPMTADAVRDRIVTVLNLHAGFSGEFTASSGGAGVVRVTRDVVGPLGTLSVLFSALDHTDVAISGATTFVAGIKEGTLDFDLTDTGPGTSAVAGVAVAHGDSATVIASAVKTALDANPTFSNNFSCATLAGVLTITRTILGNVGTLSSALTLVNVVTSRVDTFTAGTVGGNLTVDILDNSSSVLTAPAVVAILGGDSASQVANKVNTALTFAVGGVFLKNVLADKVTITRVAVGSINTISSTFAAGATAATEVSSIFSAGNAFKNITLGIDINSGGYSFLLPLAVTDITSALVATKIAALTNADGTAGAAFFAESDGAVVSFYQRVITGASLDTVDLSFVDTDATGAVAAPIAEVDGVDGDTFTLGTRVFEFIKKSLSLAGISVAAPKIPVAVEATNASTALSTKTAIGIGQTLTGEINAPSSLSEIVFLESAIAGIAENINISGESITGVLAVTGMVGGTAAGTSMVYVSGDTLITGTYKACYQKLNSSCAPILLVKQIVRDCDLTEKYTEMWAAITVQAGSLSLDEESDSTMDFTLAVGVPGGSNQA